MKQFMGVLGLAALLVSGNALADAKNQAKGYIDTGFVNDIDGDGVPEIAALRVDFKNNMPIVIIKAGVRNEDDKYPTIRINKYLNSNFNPIAMDVGDFNHDSIPDILVLGVHKTTHATRAEVRDSVTGLKIHAVSFGKAR